jgi:hypothetical protein
MEREVIFTQSKNLISFSCGQLKGLGILDASEELATSIVPHSGSTCTLLDGTKRITLD